MKKKSKWSGNSMHPYWHCWSSGSSASNSNEGMSFSVPDPSFISRFAPELIKNRNISNAASSTLFKDIGIDQDQFNMGQGLLYIGIVLLEWAVLH